MAIYKRYQYLSQEGIKWTSWFKLLNPNDKPKYQIGTQHTRIKLLNEYKYVPEWIPPKKS